MLALFFCANPCADKILMTLAFVQAFVQFCGIINKTSRKAKSPFVSTDGQMCLPGQEVG